MSAFYLYFSLWSISVVLQKHYTVHCTFLQGIGYGWNSKSIFQLTVWKWYSCIELCFGEKQVDVSRWRPEWYNSEFRRSSVLSDTLPRRTYTNAIIKSMKKTNWPLRIHWYIWGCQFYFFTCISGHTCTVAVPGDAVYARPKAAMLQG